MVLQSPYQKIIKGIQIEYDENNSKSIRIFKTEFENLLLSHVGVVHFVVSTAKRSLIDQELLIWPKRDKYCILELEKIKAVKL